MRIISYSNDIFSTNENVIVPEKGNVNSYVNSYTNFNLSKNNNDTKKNVFPDKYIYKHIWLTDGYKTTYKKDFIKHYKSKNNNF